ncbi:hypothetical protein KVR01_005227 [Diaporthe batatas]|uniref:uncharacterized protein n=1 Tax=Diaporthe batatas TaxID=748121 RepID=UPI001D05B9BA|nr:uncharacterized protein KVR01_005227 [Diaporthe batatas]KAG8164952.1 hypothetical protein KVR01_005227 [Diaporthe batatas]
MWDFFWRKKQRKPKNRQLKWTVIAPATRGQEETTALRENADDLGAAVALHQVIAASRPQNNRVMSSHMTSRLSVHTQVSNVSADSEEYIRNPYAESGRRPRRQDSSSASSPLAVKPATRAEASVDDDFVSVDKSKGKEVDQPKVIRRNMLADPLGTVLHMTVAAALAAGPPGRQYITSGPPPPDQRGRVQSSSDAQPLSMPQPPRRCTLTQRHRSVSDPAVLRDRHGVSPSSSKRSARSLGALS